MSDYWDPVIPPGGVGSITVLSDVPSRKKKKRPPGFMTNESKRKSKKPVRSKGKK